MAIAVQSQPVSEVLPSCIYHCNSWKFCPGLRRSENGVLKSDDQYLDEYFAYIRKLPAYVFREDHQEFLAVCRRAHSPEDWEKIEWNFGHLLDQPDFLRFHRTPARLLSAVGIDLYRTLWDFQRGITFGEWCILLWVICVFAMWVLMFLGLVEGTSGALMPPWVA